MVPWPIVERELRVTSRKRSTYFFRCASVLIAGIVCVWYLFFRAFYWQQNSGEELFKKIAWVAFWGALSAGLFTTADCLSSEKRQGTLGLLFLTNLRAHQVVLGKLAATSLNAVYGLVAVLPLLALPVLMGGVTLADVFFVAIALGITLFVSVSVGMLVSAISTSEFEAMLGTLLGLGAVCVMPRFLGFLIEHLFPFELYPNLPLSQFILVTNPYHMMEIAVHSFPRSYGFLVGTLFLMVASVGVFSLLLAGLIVRRSFRDGFGDLTGPIQKLWWRLRSGFRRNPAPPPPRRSLSERFRHYRGGLLDVNPMLWLVNREPLRVKYVWFILAVFLLVWLVGFFTARSVWLDWELSAFFTVLVNGSLKLLLALEAPRQVAEDRKSGSLELILSTPLPERDMLSGYAQAIHQQFLKPIVLVMVAEIILLWLGLAYQFKADWTFAAFIASAIVLLIPDALTLTTIGIWSGMRSRVPSRASWFGIFWMLIFPWVVAFPFMLVWITASHSHGYHNHSNYQDTDWHVWVIWLVAMLTYNYCFTVWAKSGWEGFLRKSAAESYAST